MGVAPPNWGVCWELIVGSSRTHRGMCMGQRLEQLHSATYPRELTGAPPAGAMAVRDAAAQEHDRLRLALLHGLHYPRQPCTATHVGYPSVPSIIGQLLSLPRPGLQSGAWQCGVASPGRKGCPTA